MKLSEIQFSEALPIESYGPDFFRIGGEIVAAPSIVTAAGAQQWAGFDDVQSIIDKGAEIDFILLGTGKDLAYAPAHFRKQLEDAGIGVEVMKTDSACRTYNVLVSEGRRVAAVLLPIEQD